MLRSMQASVKNTSLKHIQYIRKLTCEYVCWLLELQGVTFCRPQQPSSPPATMRPMAVQGATHARTDVNPTLYSLAAASWVPPRATSCASDARHTTLTLTPRCSGSRLLWTAHAVSRVRARTRAKVITFKDDCKYVSDAPG